MSAECKQPAGTVSNWHQLLAVLVGVCCLDEVRTPAPSASLAVELTSGWLLCVFEFYSVTP